MISLLIRNLIFTLLLPGMVVGFLPYYMFWDGLDKSIFPLQLNHFAAILMLIVGLSILLHSIFRFALEGRGTLAPIDPTKRLVVKGLYQYSRNPMYVGVIIILISEALFSGITHIWTYALIMFLIFNFFIVLVEEPRLRREFGDAYRDYCKKVRRWL